MRKNYSTDRFIIFKHDHKWSSSAWDNFLSHWLNVFCTADISDDLSRISLPENIFIEFLENKLKTYSAILDYHTRTIEFNSQEDKALFVLEWS